MAMNERYSRQIRFAEIGEDRQARIRKQRVLLVGCGALGTHLADMMVRSGVKSLTIIDRDILEPSNLQRQTLFTEEDVLQGLPKAAAAELHLSKINAEVETQGIVADFGSDNAQESANQCDIILDATDNFETRFLINDVATKLNKPWIYAACVGSKAMTMPIIPGQTACMNCLLEALPDVGGETCDNAGIIMPAVLSAVGMAGAEALKILSGQPEALIRKLRIVDCWAGTNQELNADSARSDCETCSQKKFPYLSGSKAASAVSLCGRNTVQVHPASRFTMGFDEVENRANGIAEVLARNAHLLKLGARKKELTLFTDGRALISGTNDLAEAKALYAQLIGT